MLCFGQLFLNNFFFKKYSEFWVFLLATLLQMVTNPVFGLIEVYARYKKLIHWYDSRRYAWIRLYHVQTGLFAPLCTEILYFCSEGSWPTSAFLVAVSFYLPPFFHLLPSLVYFRRFDSNDGAFFLHLLWRSFWLLNSDST